MKRQILTLILSLCAICFLATTMSAQLISSNNLGVFPPTGPFDPNGKFTSIGESGGVPGPTVDGCDLYGFRAQVTPTRNVNLGMQKFSLLGLVFDIPTLSFETTATFWIVEKGADGGGGGISGGCGKLLAFYNDTNSGTSSNNVFTVAGSATASGGIWQPSDLKLKRNVEKIPDALEIVERLNGVTYEYRTDERPGLNLTAGRQYGFLTQEVAEVMPEAVMDAYDEFGQLADYDVMQYTAIIPVLTEAVKQQQQIINLLEERIAILEREMSGEGTIPNPTLDNSINTNRRNDVELRQNRPNPFVGVTTIEYNIPLEMKEAQLVVYDMNGTVLNSFVVDAGLGSVDYDASNLSGGVYFYAIVSANGETLARQKMVVQ